jgi:hypothetical protein
MMEQEKAGKARIVGYGIGLAVFIVVAIWNFWFTEKTVAKNGALENRAPSATLNNTPLETVR